MICGSPGAVCGHETVITKVLSAFHSFDLSAHFAGVGRSIHLNAFKCKPCMLPKAYVCLILVSNSATKRICSLYWLPASVDAPQRCHKVLLEANRINSLTFWLVQLQFANKVKNVNRILT